MEQALIRMEQAFRIFDFNVYSEKETFNNGSESDEQEQEQVVYKDTTIFLIQIFGVNELGETFSAIVEGLLLGGFGRGFGIAFVTSN